MSEAFNALVADLSRMDMEAPLYVVEVHDMTEGSSSFTVYTDSIRAMNASLAIARDLDNQFPEGQFAITVHPAADGEG